MRGGREGGVRERGREGEREGVRWREGGMDGWREGGGGRGGKVSSLIS